MFTVQELKNKAEALLKKAQQLESKNLVDAGKVVKKYLEKDFKDFDLEKFKEEVEKVFQK